MTRAIITVAVLTAFLTSAGIAVGGGEEVYSAPIGRVLSGGGAKGTYEIGVWEMAKAKMVKVTTEP